MQEYIKMQKDALLACANLKLCNEILAKQNISLSSNSDPGGFLDAFMKPGWLIAIHQPMQENHRYLIQSTLNCDFINSNDKEINFIDLSFEDKIVYDLSMPDEIKKSPSILLIQKKELIDNLKKDYPDIYYILFKPLVIDAYLTTKIKFKPLKIFLFRTIALCYISFGFFFYGKL